MGDAGDGDVLANLTNSSASGKEAPGAGELVVGIILTLMGAATLAFSMTIQRYALAHPKPTIPYCGLQLKKKWVWGFGLLLYGVANVFKVARPAPSPAPPRVHACTHARGRTPLRAAPRQLLRRTGLSPRCAEPLTQGRASGAQVIGLMFGPMTVLSSVFTTLLIFNLFIANKLLDEKITPPKVAGAVFILVGAGLCTGATPEGIPENYSPDDVIGLLSKPPPVRPRAPPNPGRRGGGLPSASAAPVPRLRFSCELALTGWVVTWRRSLAGFWWCSWCSSRRRRS